MTASVRGEVEFKQDDIEFKVRPSFQLVAELEAELGQSVLVLFNRARELTLTYTETVKIVLIAARRSDNPPKLKADALAEAIFQAGPSNWYVPMIKLLTEIFVTGRSSSTEKNAAAGKTTTKKS